MSTIRRDGDEDPAWTPSRLPQFIQASGGLCGTLEWLRAAFLVDWVEEPVGSGHWRFWRRIRDRGAAERTAAILSRLLGTTYVVGEAPPPPERPTEDEEEDATWWTLYADGHPLGDREQWATPASLAQAEGEGC